MRHVAFNACCPDRDTWSSFYAGMVPAGAIDGLVEHLDHCPSCQGVLHALAGETVGQADALFANLQGAPSNADAYEAEAECRRAVERARLLVPGEVSEPAPIALPSQLGEYRLLRLIGRGGMGNVYRAVHVRLGREVALKVIPPERVRDTALARFQREMVAHGKLDHPNVVRATDAGEANGAAFLVTDLVDGIDLDGLVRACGPLPVADACELARQVAAGLHHLSGHGLVHRDVKPLNLMLDRGGTVKVLDLGLAAHTDRGPHPAKSRTADTALTSDGQILGTFDYLPPEQANPVGAVDARADVYGLGCSLYFLLTGAAPYEGTAHLTPRSKVLAHTVGPVPQVRSTRPDVPEPLARVLSRMLAKNPGHRFPSADAVAYALAPFCAGADPASLLRRAGLEPLPPATLPLPAAVRAPRVKRVALAAGAVVALLFVAGARQWLASATVSPAEPQVQQTEPPKPQDPKRVAARAVPIALLGFDERGGAVDGLGAAVSDLLFAKLAAKPGLHLVDRTDLKKALDEQRLSLSGAVSPAEAVRVGQLVGAKLIVTGSVVRADRRLHLIAKIIGTETTQVIGAPVSGAITDDLTALVERLATAVEDAVSRHGDELLPAPVPVADRIAALNKRLGGAARPVVGVWTTEREFGLPAGGAAARTEVTKFAKETGFEVTYPGRAAVVITGDAFSEVIGRAEGLVSVRARVELKATDRKTGKILAEDRQTAIAVDLADAVAAHAAVQSATAELVERLLPQLVTPVPKP
ncbi:serine/threonine-protein kinase [Gemmata sp. JC717]|uniref:protein kinase domain-containing protein n=1 Tax=Gemmata algarum TaxID=2975278 RepID=UPI0021BA6148|nr:serine/threonine-protein kinase [Gemmata algarum]MDY3553728.1 serine/threonine-protein kinase [Gemmata algarum]